MSDTDRILNDIRAYLRITAAAASKAVAAETIDTQEKAQVYSKLDGKTSQPKIQSSIGVPQRTISDWLTIFVGKGLVTPPNEICHNHKALFTLQELEISLSELKKRKKKGQGGGNRNEQPN